MVMWEVISRLMKRERLVRSETLTWLLDVIVFQVSCCQWMQIWILLQVVCLHENAMSFRIFYLHALHALLWGSVVAGMKLSNGVCDLYWFLSLAWFWSNHCGYAMRFEWKWNCLVECLGHTNTFRRQRDFKEICNTLNNFLERAPCYLGESFCFQFHLICSPFGCSKRPWKRSKVFAVAGAT